MASEPKQAVSRRCVTISDFNLDNFNSLLVNGEGDPAIEIVDAPFGQVQQLLIDRDAACWAEPLDVAVVWVQPQSIIETFRRALEFHVVTPQDVIAEVDSYADQLLALTDRARIVLVPAWVMPAQERGLGIFDFVDSRGARNLLMRMNLHLAERLQGDPSVFLLNANQWTEGIGSDAFNSKLWYMAKMAFSNSVFKKAAADIKMALRTLEGNAKKLIVVDLDNTLWGGVVGELGWKGLTLGGHDAVGEAFVDFQLGLKALQRRGIVLAVASKNEESVALEAMQHHPEMILRPDDFAAWRIDWNDKAQNVADIAAELNLGLQSTVFIDDNPVERARVDEALEEVLVPNWPVDPLLYRSALVELSCFDSATISDEDIKRAEMYQQQRKRDAGRINVGSIDDWLESLNTEISVTPLNDSNLARAAQLLNKTNQMNLATRRLSESELMEWAKVGDRAVWTLRVTDRFGSQGLTGICSVRKNSERLEIVDFLLSCRVMGRKIEETMLSVAIDYASAQGLTGVDAIYLPTKKNQPCLDFFKRSAMRHSESGGAFHWECADKFPVPQQVKLELIQS